MKNKILKYFLSILLCVCFFFNSFAIIVFAVNPILIAIANYAITELSNAAVVWAWNTIKTNSDPEVIFEYKSRWIAILREFALKHNLDYDTAYSWLVDCCAEWDIHLMDKYGDNASDMWNYLHEPVWQLCNNYTYQMDLATLAELITKPEAKAPEITEDNKVKVPASSFNDFVNENNSRYFPKNTTGKMSYRTDDRWHTAKSKLSWSSVYRDMTTYYSEPPKKFFALGNNRDDAYFVFFYRDNTDTYYSAYQYHFIVTRTDKWYEDRDEIESSTFTYEVEYWNMTDSTQEEAYKATLFENVSYLAFDLSPFLYSGKNDTIAVRFYGNSESHYAFNPQYAATFQHSELDLFYSSDLSSIKLNYNSVSHFDGADLSVHDSKCSFGGVCDFGYLASGVPIELTYKLDTSRINNNYYITIGGDTIYDYSITNPETGQSDTIYNYITNNYTYITNEGEGGSSSGDITVGGHIDVSGDVDVNVGVDVTVSVPDINININQGPGVGSGSFDPDHSYDLPASDPFNGYYDAALDETSGFRQFLGSFFGFLPVELVSLLGIGLTFVILARIFGR